MKDYPIGKVFNHPKFGCLKVVAREDGYCDGCVFNGKDNKCNNDADNRHTGECAAQNRIDHTDVIFVENRVSDVERDNCTDNRFEVIAAAKKALLERTNIKSSHAEMAVLDNFLMRCWQMGWLSQYDPICRAPKDDNEPLYHY